MTRMTFQGFEQRHLTSTPVELAPPAPAAVAEVREAPLDVIYVLSCLAIGGSEKKTVRIANGLAQRGVKVGLVYLNAPDTLLETVSPQVKTWCLERSGKFSPAAAARLRRIAAATRARAIVAVNLYPALYIAAAAAFLQRPRPLTICLINTSSDDPRPSWRLRRLLYKSVLGGFDRTVHGCDAYRRLWVAPHNRGWSRSDVIYNGVDLMEFSPAVLAAPREQLRALYGIGAGRFVFGTVGRLVSGKNQCVLIETLARIHWAGLDAHLLLVGDGPMRSALAQRAEQLGVRSRVAFTGALSDVRPALAAMDVFVLPSVEVETFSNAALEAMAMEKPAILSDIGGAAEMLENGVEGFLVSPNELGARLPALLQHLYADERRRHAMGAAARARVQDRFSLTKLIDDHLRLIETDEGNRTRVT